MTFTTLTFLLFLSAVFPLYWCAKDRFRQNVLLLFASYFFYGWWDYRFCALMLFTSLLDYSIGLLIYKSDVLRWRRFLLLLNIICNLGVLGFFKYYHFFADNFQLLAAPLGWHVHPVTMSILLPAGISFYTFQAMSYTIDIYRRKMVPTTHVVEYLAFISFFPHLVAGPIMRAAHLLPQFLRPRHFCYSEAVDGCRQILWGFCKKMMVADNLAPYVDRAYAHPQALTGPQLALATVCFAFQIYCDFSAYSDIAIGTAKLFGFELMRNFAYPYFAPTMAEFWHRWHISLSTWFRDYVYIPLGGRYVSRWRRALNVMITFLLSGLWHGAAWNFVVWGGLNGLAVLPATLRSAKTRAHADDGPVGGYRLPSLGTLTGMLGTFILTCIFWTFFRAPTLADALTILQHIGLDAFNFPVYGTLFTALSSTCPIGRKVLLFTTILLCAEWIQRAHPHPCTFDKWPQPVRWLAYTGLLWATLYWGPHSPVQFIYFQF